MAKKFVEVYGLHKVFATIGDATAQTPVIVSDASVSVDKDSILYVTCDNSDASIFGPSFGIGTNWIWAKGKLINGNNINFIDGTQTSATNAWTGNSTTISNLYDGLTITYRLPYVGTSTAATLNLTLADGTTTGAKNVYITGITRCTNHVKAGDVVQMTYLENKKISGSGSYTGWWISKAFDTNNITGTGVNGYLVKFTGAHSVTTGPKLGTDTSTFLRNDGTWAVPPSGGGSGETTQYDTDSDDWYCLTLGSESSSDPTDSISTDTEGDLYTNDGIKSNPSQGVIRVTGGYRLSDNAIMEYNSNSQCIDFRFL